MSVDEIPDAETVVGQYWPRYGPYSMERTRAAGSVISELVRYLNYATGQGARDAVPYAVVAGDLLGGVKGAAGGLDQMLRQLADRCETFAADPALYDHTNRNDHAAAAARARSAIDALSDAMRAADLLYAALNSAQNHLSYLGHREQ